MLRQSKDREKMCNCMVLDVTAIFFWITAFLKKLPFLAKGLPHLEYYIQAWSPYLRKDIDMLEKIQRRATKLIPELRDLRYEERLKECGLTTLETRWLRGDQIEVLNGYENIDSNIFFEIKESKITRGHNYTLVKKQSRLDVRKYSFSQRTINVWNKWSTDCVHASSVNMFKNKIDKYLAKAGYT